MIAVARSERRFGPTLPDTDDDAVDPESHPIVPDDFVETMDAEASYDVDDFEEALHYAERRPSTTDPATRPRCPVCGSPEIRRTLDTTRGKDQQRRGRFKCGCGAYFDEPEPSPREWAADAVERVDTAATHAARLAAALEVER